MMHLKLNRLKIFFMMFIMLLIANSSDFSFATLQESTNQNKTLSLLDVGVEIPLIIGYDPSLPPYQFVENSEYKGFFIDLLSEIAQTSELNITLIPMPLNICYEKYAQGEIHGILGIRYSDNKEQSLNMVFSESLVNSTISLVMLKNNTSDIKDRLGSSNVLIAVEQNSVEFEFIKNIKKTNFNLTFNQESVLSLLLARRADMIIGVRHVAEYILEQKKLTNQYTISNSFETPIDFYLALNSKYETIIGKFNSELRKLKINGQYETLYNKWINDKLLENQKRTERNLLIMFLIILSVVLLSFVVAAINVQLKLKIDVKTHELSYANLELEKKIFEIKNTVELKDLIFESSPRCIAVFDNEGNISAMNEPVLKLCNLSKIPLGESIYKFSPLNEMISEYIDNVFNDGNRYMGLEYQYETNNSKTYFRYYLYPLYDYEKNSRGAIITIEDITEERIFKAQSLERAKNKALTRLISGIAHEIRNPLTSIKTYAELLPRKMDNERFKQQISTVIPAEVERVNKLIENLIDYVKPKTKNIETFLLSDVVESCKLLFQASMETRDIHLDTIIDFGLFITADKSQIKQVLINLILNSIDAVEEMRSHLKSHDFLIDPSKKYFIKISSEITKDKIEILVADNGIGMNVDALEYIFELFYTTKQKGSGIGLSISKQLIEENNGKIDISSELYSGTTISIKLEASPYET